MQSREQAERAPCIHCGEPDPVHVFGCSHAPLHRQPWHYYCGTVWTTPNGIDDDPPGACILTRSSLSPLSPETKDESLRVASSAPYGLELALHVLALEGDPYMEGHPEWQEIIEDARLVLDVAGVNRDGVRQ